MVVVLLGDTLLDDPIEAIVADLAGALGSHAAGGRGIRNGGAGQREGEG